ncbi:MAG: MiaB/RimO family radical SAM methylthiotransferase [Candidatus Dormibacteria bacterium]
MALTALGCKVNFAEMAELAGALAAAGCDVVPDHEHADIRVLNSCTVTTQADATTRQRLRRLRRADPGAHIVLTGCSVDANPRLYPDEHSRASTNGLVDAVFANRDKRAIARHIVDHIGARDDAPRATASPSFRSRAFIKVQDGCKHRCTYCIVWRARGASMSVPVSEVFDAVDRAVAAGHGEVVLCGVDLGSYGRDIGTTLAELLAALLDRVSARARIRLSSINANDLTPALVELAAHPRLCAHWHMPLQSGSDTILRAMHRGYRRKQYLKLVDALRAQERLTEFTTDIMVAFPGETEDDHRQTLALVEDVGFHSSHVFRWSPRPDTPAATYAGAVEEATARRRSAEVRRTAAHAGDASRRRAVGRVHEVVWEGDMNPARGLSSTYHEVLVPDAHPRPGALAHVRAVDVDGGRLRGEVVSAP